jgi:hypothetical protein
MDLDALWIELETNLPHEASGYVRQRIHPESAADLLAVVSNPGPQRALWLQTDAAAIEHLDEIQAARGVALSVIQGDGRSTVELRLTDPAAMDVFTALAVDVAETTAAAGDDQTAVRAFVGRFSRWMQLLQRAPQGLTGERQRGLFGELWFIRERLAPAVGPDDGIATWQAPGGVPHDFQAATGSVEIKTSAANQPQVVRVNGERQLDETGTPVLYLVHLSLDVHRDSGETLPEMVAGVRSLVAGGRGQPLFEDRLLASGYADLHTPLYAHTGYTLRQSSAFLVGDGFPRIVERDLPDGVGAVHYKLAIAACAPFSAPEVDAVDALKGDHVPS